MFGVHPSLPNDLFFPKLLKIISSRWNIMYSYWLALLNVTIIIYINNNDKNFKKMMIIIIMIHMIIGLQEREWNSTILTNIMYRNHSLCLSKGDALNS